MAKSIKIGSKILIFLGLLIGMQLTASAQADQRGIFKIYPLDLMTGNFYIGYERPIPVSPFLDKMTGELTIGYHWRNYFISEQVKHDIIDRLDNAFQHGKGITIRLGVNYHIPGSKEEIPFGFYISPQILIKSTKYKELFVEFTEGCQVCSNNSKTIDVKQFLIGLNAIVGYQTILFSDFTLSAYTGLGIRYKNITETKIDVRGEIVTYPIPDVEGNDDFQSDTGPYGKFNPAFFLGLTIGYRGI